MLLDRLYLIILAVSASLAAVVRPYAIRSRFSFAVSLFHHQVYGHFAFEAGYVTFAEVIA